MTDKTTRFNDAARPDPGGHKQVSWLAIAAVVLTVLFAGCGSSRPSGTRAKGGVSVSGPGMSTRVLIVDRTGVAADGPYATGWRSEAVATAGTVFDDAVDAGTDTLEIWSLGSNAAQGGLITPISLKFPGNTGRKRGLARIGRRRAVQSEVANLLANPVMDQGTNGTDIVSALDGAVASCKANGKCSAVIVLGDLIDSRVQAAASPAAAEKEFGPAMPDLRGTSVTVIGVGASGASVAETAKTTAIWKVLFRKAGASHVSLRRSM